MGQKRWKYAGIMGRLKPDWIKTNIPKHVKIVLWRLMKDNPTYTSWAQAIAKHGFSKEDEYYVSNTKDTYSALRKEVRYIPNEEILALPNDIREWMYQVRKEISVGQSQLVYPRLYTPLSDSNKSFLHIRAIIDHQKEIHSFLERWYKELDVDNLDYLSLTIVRYCSIEDDLRFRYILQHCPSVNMKYELFRMQRRRLEESVSELTNAMKKEIPLESNNYFIEIAAHYTIACLGGIEIPDEYGSEFYPRVWEGDEGTLFGYLASGSQHCIAKGDAIFLNKCEVFHKQLIDKYYETEEALAGRDCYLVADSSYYELAETIQLSSFSKEYMIHDCELCRPLS